MSLRLVAAVYTSSTCPINPISSSDYATPIEEQKGPEKFTRDIHRLYMVGLSTQDCLYWWVYKYNLNSLSLRLSKFGVKYIGNITYFISQHIKMSKTISVNGNYQPLHRYSVICFCCADRTRAALLYLHLLYNTVYCMG